MTISRSWWMWCIPLCTLLSLGACNAEQPLAEVSCVVLLDGEPMPDALVEFLPDPEQETHGPRCSGITDAQGRARLVCDDERAGAVIGFHRVLVQDVRTFPPPRNKQTPGKPPIMPDSRVSPRYRTASTTPLRQQVQSGPQTITVEVTGK